uniref:Uncharacterized protein n=1 Tax=Anguilla anguilla TaxID=7936 RepID=A0A0E9PW56_ANGAN
MSNNLIWLGVNTLIRNDAKDRVHQ